MSNQKKQAYVKKRNWGFIMYPESMPDDWLDILIHTGLPCAVSPLHDSDLNPDGELKKSHYHVLICYSGPVTDICVKRITDSLNASNPVGIESVRGNYRYFTHMDNPEKHQYDVQDIVSLNGFSILDYVEYTKSEVLKTKRELVELIQNLGLVEYSDFIDYVLSSGSDLDFDVASSHTLFFNGYLKSARMKAK